MTADSLAIQGARASVATVLTKFSQIIPALAPGGRFKNTYELLNLRALKISKLHKNHIFQCMG